jgi:hypothetical protein
MLKYEFGIGLRKYIGIKDSFSNNYDELVNLVMESTKTSGITRKNFREKYSRPNHEGYCDIHKWIFKPKNSYGGHIQIDVAMLDIEKETEKIGMVEAFAKYIGETEKNFKPLEKIVRKFYRHLTQKLEEFELHKEVPPVYFGD